MEDQKSVSIKKAIDDLLETNIFKEISKRNNQEFTQQLAIWLVKYILVIASMNESLKINLEETLFNLHGEKFRKILEITEKTFRHIHEGTEGDTPYIG